MARNNSDDNLAGSRKAGGACDIGVVEETMFDRGHGVETEGFGRAAEVNVAVSSLTIACLVHGVLEHHQ